MIDSSLIGVRSSISKIASERGASLITIGMTAFNAVMTIERALAGALSQDWPNFEVVVVDDKSTDGTYELLARKAATEPRLKLIQNPVNSGCAAARNTLVMYAKGEFLAFFDDDDSSTPDRLKLQHDHIIAYERQHGVGMLACYASGTRVYPNGYEVAMPAVGSQGLPPAGRVMADYLLFNNRCRNTYYGAGAPTCALMVRTTVLRQLSGFDPLLRRQEDIDLAIRLAFMGGHFIGVRANVLTQFVSDGKDKGNLIEYQSTLRILEKNKAYLKDRRLYFYMRTWTLIRYHHFSGQDQYAFLCFITLLMFFPLRTLAHFSRSASKRFMHERRIKELTTTENDRIIRINWLKFKLQKNKK